MLFGGCEGDAVQFVRLSHRAAHTQVITCMETLKKNVEEEDAVTSLVVGTESRYTSSPSLLFSVGPLSFVHSAQRLRSADPDLFVEPKPAR